MDNISTFSDLELFYIGCFRIVSSYTNTGLVFLPVWNLGEGSTDPPTKKKPSKNEVLDPSSWNKIIKVPQSLPEEPIIVSMYSIFIIL